MTLLNSQRSLTSSSLTYARGGYRLESTIQYTNPTTSSHKTHASREHSHHHRSFCVVDADLRRRMESNKRQVLLFPIISFLACLHALYFRSVLIGPSSFTFTYSNTSESIGTSNVESRSSPTDVLSCLRFYLFLESASIIAGPTCMPFVRLHSRVERIEDE
jgi:hypothetical protein